MSTAASLPRFKITFADSIKQYTYSWEGYKSQKGDKYNQVQRSIKRATIGEIINQYNMLSFSNLWNEPLRQLFIDEITDRILSDATFALMTVWRSIKDWSSKPFVFLLIGFEDSYDILDENGEPVLENDPGVTYTTVINNELSEENQRKIIGLLLKNNQPQVTLRYNENKVWITQIADVPLQAYPDLSNEVIVPATIYRSPDLHILYLMLEGIEKKTYHILNIGPKINKEVESLFDNDPVQFSDFEIVPLPPPEDIIKKIQEKTEYAGLWDKIHLTALKCRTPEDVARFSIWIWDVCKNLPCSECKYHMLHYILQNPPQDCVVDTGLIGSEKAHEQVAFYWSWKFHNEVNARIGKPEVPYEVAFDRYSQML